MFLGFAAIIAGVSAAAVVGLIAAGICWYRYFENTTLFYLCSCCCPKKFVILKKITQHGSML